MKSMGALSSSDLHWLDLKIGYQGGSPNNGHQGNIPCYLLDLNISNVCWEVHCMV